MSALQYGIATAADAADIIQLIAKVFSLSEPPAVAVGLSAVEMQRFLAFIVPEMLSARLTSIARDCSSGQLAGAFLAHDLASPLNVGSRQISPRFAPIMAMLDHLDEQFVDGRAIQPGHYLHLLMLGVEPRFTGLGVAKSLLTHSLQNGTEKSYRMALAELTGKVSQHIFRMQGFTERARVSYQEFRWGEETPFASIREHEAAILMEKTLRE